MKTAVAPPAHEVPPAAADDVVAELQEIYIEKGTPMFMRTVLALFSGGFATFALLYCVQPMMPLLSHEYSINAAQSSLILSVATGMLAIGLLITGPISDRIGRKPVMVLRFSPSDLHHGQCNDAELGRRVDHARTDRPVAEWPGGGGDDLSERRDSPAAHRPGDGFVHRRQRDWRDERALDHRRVDRLCQLAHGDAGIGGLAMIAAAVFWKILPESRNFRSRSLHPRSLLDGFTMHFRDAGLPLLFLEAFVLMGAFVTLFNYIGYRLLAAPYNLDQVFVGLLSVVYLSGIYSSAKIGSLADKLGRRKVLWATIALMFVGLALTLFTPLPLVIVGMLIFTFGFFGAHSVASSWIGRRALKAKGQASSLYLFSYYAGSSIAGTAGGVFWHLGGWNGIGLFIGALLLIALLVALKLAKLPPLTGATI